MQNRLIKLKLDFRFVIFFVYLSSISIVLISLQDQNVFGNGNTFVQEIIPPLNTDEVTKNLFVSFDPILSPSNATSNKIINIRLLDERDLNQSSKKNELITFNISISKMGDIISAEKYEEINLVNKKKIITHDGIVRIDLVRETNDSMDFEQFAYDNKTFENINNEYNNASFFKEYPLHKIFVNEKLDNGPYHFKIKIEKNNKSINEDLYYDSWITSGEILETKINKVYENENTLYPLTIKSFYGKILDFDYNSKEGSISWKVPYFYNITRIEEGLIYIHTEVIIPKSITRTVTTTANSNYDNSIKTFINNKLTEKIDDTIISIDPYSSESNIIIHYVLNSNSLFILANEIINNNKNGEDDNRIEFKIDLF